MYDVPPQCPLFNVLPYINFPHIFLHYIRKSSLWPPFFFLATPFPSPFFLHTPGLLMTYPYHLSLLSLIFIPNHSTLTILMMYSFLILSFLVPPIANLNIFISATCIYSICFFVTATISSPYIIAGLTSEL